MDFHQLLNYIKEIDLTKVDGDSIILSDQADEALAQLLEVEEFVKEAKEKLKERYTVIAQQNPKLKKYEGDKTSVGYRIQRRKKITGNPDPKFVIKKEAPNTPAINAYRDALGELPTGIGEETFEFISFKLN